MLKKLLFLFLIVQLSKGQAQSNVKLKDSEKNVKCSNDIGKMQFSTQFEFSSKVNIGSYFLLPLKDGSNKKFYSICKPSSLKNEGLNDQGTLSSEEGDESKEVEEFKNQLEKFDSNIIDKFKKAFERQDEIKDIQTSIQYIIYYQQMDILKSSYIYFQDIESIFLSNFNKILGGIPDLNYSDIKNHLFQNNSICKAKSKIIKISNRLKRINRTKSQNKHLSLKLNYSGVNTNITKITDEINRSFPQIVNITLLPLDILDKLLENYTNIKESQITNNNQTNKTQSNKTRINLFKSALNKMNNTLFSPDSSEIMILLVDELKKRLKIAKFNLLEPIKNFEDNIDIIAEESIERIENLKSLLEESEFFEAFEPFLEKIEKTIYDFSKTFNISELDEILMPLENIDIIKIFTNPDKLRNDVNLIREQIMQNLYSYKDNFIKNIKEMSTIDDLIKAFNGAIKDFLNNINENFNFEEIYENVKNNPLFNSSTDNRILINLKNLKDNMENFLDIIKIPKDIDKEQLTKVLENITETIKDSNEFFSIKINDSLYSCENEVFEGNDNKNDPIIQILNSSFVSDYIFSSIGTFLDNLKDSMLEDLNIINKAERESQKLKYIVYNNSLGIKFINTFFDNRIEKIDTFISEIEEYEDRLIQFENKTKYEEYNKTVELLNQKLREINISNFIINLNQTIFENLQFASNSIGKIKKKYDSLPNIKEKIKYIKSINNIVSQQRKKTVNNITDFIIDIQFSKYMAIIDKLSPELINTFGVDVEEIKEKLKALQISVKETKKDIINRDNIDSNITQLIKDFGKEIKEQIKDATIAKKLKEIFNSPVIKKFFSGDIIEKLNQTIQNPEQREKYVEQITEYKDLLIRLNESLYTDVETFEGALEALGNFSKNNDLFNLANIVNPEKNIELYKNLVQLGLLTSNLNKTISKFVSMIDKVKNTRNFNYDKNRYLSEVSYRKNKKLKKHSLKRINKVRRIESSEYDCRLDDSFSENKILSIRNTNLNYLEIKDNKNYNIKSGSKLNLKITKDETSICYNNAQKIRTNVQYKSNTNYTLDRNNSRFILLLILEYYQNIHLQISSI